ncbi:hypothetical protein BH10PSE9_BH10PSE9_09240 [soil metagenome]
MSVRTTGAAALIATGLMLTASGAQAQFRIEFNGYCERLQSQYLSALRQGGDGPSGATMVQMDSLSRQLAAAQVAAQRNNCNGGFIFGPPPSRACPAIRADINRLSRELSQLRGGNNFGLFGFYSPQQEAARLRDVLAESGCAVPDSYGGTRTLCVRICDGYYFPINAQANSTRFQTDAMACQSMYAEGGQAELFVQPGGADIQDATSIATGKRYGDLSNALLYREAYVPACATQLKTGIAALVSRYLALLPRKRAAIIAALKRPMPPVPKGRPPASEDPETLTNLDGRFRIAPVMAEAVPLVADAASKAVRMVGAAYYADLFNLEKVRQQQDLRPSISLIGSAAAAETPAVIQPGPAPAQP